MSPISLLSIVIIYFGILFLINKYVNKSHENIVNNPYIYSLALAAYCTSWTFYGSVGAATKSGFLFLTIYLGPLMCIGLWSLWVRKLIRIKNKFRITSIVDLVSARYDKSESLGILAAAFIIMGTIPYIALQLKALIKSTLALVDSSANLSPMLVGLGISLLMAFTAIAFGIRKLDASERHPGMILVLATECVVKLIAFLCVGLYATYFIGGGFEEIFNKIPSIVSENYFWMGASTAKNFSVWVTYLILSFSAILFLPRQFHVVVVENFSEEHVRTAKWLFPLYLFLINLFVIPIAMVGMESGIPLNKSDLYVLLLPLENGNLVLSTLVYIGGFSAGAGMIMIGTITLSTIFSNHLFLPLISRSKRLMPLSKMILTVRRVFAVVLILTAFAYMVALGNKSALVSMGLISFAAALQFAPVILGGIFWEKGSRTGAHIGLIAGFLTWFYTLVVPAFVKSDLLPQSLLSGEFFGTAMLKPEALLGFEGMHFLTHAVFWTMLLNISGYIIGSLFFEQRDSEKIIAKDFIEASVLDEVLLPETGLSADIKVQDKLEIIKFVFNQFLDENLTEEFIKKTLEKLSITEDQMISVMQLSELSSEFEILLAGSIGTANSNRSISESDFVCEDEKDKLSKEYAQLITSLNIDPRELKKKIVLYQEREKLFDTHTKELEETINQRTTELEDQKEKTFNASKLSALGEMTSSIAHEINNPLAILELNTRLIQKVIGKSEITNEQLDELVLDSFKTIDRISKIVVAMRNISRDVSDENFERFTISDILEDTLALCKDKFKNNGVNLELNYTQDTIENSLICRRISISQVLINILNNAFYAATEETEKWVRLSLELNEKLLTIRVTDSGPGIPKEIADKILQPFYTTKPIGSGTGLGLSLSDSIIKDHKGKFYINDDSSNTEFVIELPLNHKIENGAIVG